jgi:hypothetical protein
MTERDGPAGPDLEQYPDVAAAGDLRTALQAAFDAVGVQHVASPGWLRVGAKVSTGDRHANLLAAMNERLFLFDCWMRGVRMATGSSVDLNEIAAAIATFLSGARVRQLVTAWPFVETWEFAEAFERGEPDAIAVRWQQYLEIPPPRARHMVDLHEFLTAAAREPELRALLPFTSHENLGFRRSVGEPRSPALAWVRPVGDGRYLVTGPAHPPSPGPVGSSPSSDKSVREIFGPANAQDSVALVLAILNKQPQR